MNVYKNKHTHANKNLKKKLIKPMRTVKRGDLGLPKGGEQMLLSSGPLEEGAPCGRGQGSPLMWSRNKKTCRPQTMGEKLVSV